MESKLYKSNDVIINGVCDGIAQYFGFKTKTLRVIWIISILFGGLGIWSYIALSILMPSKTDSV